MGNRVADVSSNGHADVASTSRVSRPVHAAHPSAKSSAKVVNSSVCVHGYSHAARQDALETASRTRSPTPCGKRTHRLIPSSHKPNPLRDKGPFRNQ